MNPSVENSCATTSSSTLSLTAKICCPWRNSPSSHILRIIISGLKSELWFSTTEEPVLFGPVGPFRVAWSAYMTKQMKTVFIYKSSGTLRAFPFCLIFFHFRTLYDFLHVLYGTVGVTASSNTLMKKMLTTLQFDKRWERKITTNCKENERSTCKKVGICICIFCEMTFLSWGLRTT